MKAEDFVALLRKRLYTTERVLGVKAREYAPGCDRLRNFKRAAALTGETPAQVCVGYMAKDLVSILDIVDSLAHGVVVRAEMTEEKIGGAINYLILLEAIIKEKQEAVTDDCGYKASWRLGPNWYSQDYPTLAEAKARCEAEMALGCKDAFTRPSDKPEKQ